MLHEIKVKPFQNGRTTICKTFTQLKKELKKLEGLKIVMSFARSPQGFLFVFEPLDAHNMIVPNQNLVAFEAPCPPFCTPTNPNLTNLYIEVA